MRSEMRYQYDLAGRVIQFEEVGSATTKYSYDAVDRLTSEARVPVQGTPQTIQYAYDAAGNRTASITSEGVESYTYETNDQLIAVSGADARQYTYDAAGRLIRRIDSPDQRVEYAWDAEDRLTRATLVAPEGTITVEYAYDAAGAMVSRSVNGEVTRYLVDGNRGHWQIVEERDSQGVTLARNAYGPTGRLSREIQGVVEYYHADRLGTVRFTSDSSGASGEAMVTDAFGNSDTVLRQPYLFAGERRDPVTGLDDLRSSLRPCNRSVPQSGCLPRNAGCSGFPA